MATVFIIGIESYVEFIFEINIETNNLLKNMKNFKKILIVYVLLDLLVFISFI